MGENPVCICKKEPHVSATHYFFHSFPRPRRGEDRAMQLMKGLAILRSLLDNGLLLTPEVYELPVFNDSGETDSLLVIQRRVCFTELTPEFLPEHSATFGPFTLIYDSGRLRQFGALPVFYVPTSLPGGYLSGLAMDLVGGIVDAKRLVDTIARVHQELQQSNSFRLRYRGHTVEFDPTATVAVRTFIEALADSAKADPTEIAERFTTLSSCFYPAENSAYTEPLYYYRQREWRIVTGPIRFQGKPYFTPATSEQAEQLLTIDSDFFSKELRFHQAAEGIGAIEHDSIARRCYFFKTLGKLDVVGSARAIVIPDDCTLPTDLDGLFQEKGLVVVNEASYLNALSDGTINL